MTISDSDPTCSVSEPSSNGSTSVVRMTCSVKLTGNWLPIMHWRRQNETSEVGLIVNGSTESRTSNNLEDVQFHINETSRLVNDSVTLTSVLTVRRNVSTNQANGNEHYQCVTFFTLDQKPTGQPQGVEYYTVVHNKNVPDYNHSCHINVLWHINV